MKQPEYRKMYLSFTAFRIGKQAGEKRRMLKIVLKSYNTREIIMSHAPKLKDAAEPWEKIYINRDTHSVYSKEHQRIRKRFKELKKRSDLQHTDAVKLV